MKRINKVEKLVFFTLMWSFLSNLHRVYSTENENWGKVLLLTAHPDDESMFFSPLLYHTKPFVLCLSNGNFDGIGHLREVEMQNLCSVLGIRHKILGYSDNDDWNAENIALDVLKYVITNKINCIATFGKKGVSGHKNHTSCHNAMRLLENSILHGSNNLLKFKYLKDWSIFEKYLFIFDKCNFVLPLNSFYGFRNMLIFKTQMVWFRYIYCVFSNYMHSNLFT